jgi:hypothetical protein
MKCVLYRGDKGNPASKTVSFDGLKRGDYQTVSFSTTFFLLP